LKIDNLNGQCHIGHMETDAINIEESPRLKNPVFIAGFDGWGNALNVSRGMVDFLISRLGGRRIARLDPDTFYRYDASRPVVTIEEGVLKKYRPPRGDIFAIETEPDAHDLVILAADEPNLSWDRLVDELCGFLKSLGVKTIITLGGLFDNVLHTERTISGIVSNEGMKSLLRQKGINPISYHGPTTIHSTIHWEGQKRGFECLSLWCRCPYYIQSVTHFGLMSALGELLAFLGNFEINTRSLEENWEKLEIEIREMVEKNPQIKSVVEGLMKQKTRGASVLNQSAGSKEKVINLMDFIDPK
jgi:proteasome assembly chaperone (PAC2) family protein